MLQLLDLNGKQQMLDRLEVLPLESNQFWDRVPSQLGKLTCLARLSRRSNWLSGGIALEPRALKGFAQTPLPQGCC